MENYEEQPVLTRQTNWDVLFLYQKSDVIYQLTFAFCTSLYTFTRTAHVTK